MAVAVAVEAQLIPEGRVVLDFFESFGPALHVHTQALTQAIYDGTFYSTRDVLYVYGMYDGEPLHVFVNHWPSRRGGEEASAPKRALAASIAKSKIDSINQASPGAKIILMGDLNDDPVSPSVAKVLGATGDMKRIKSNGCITHG